MHLFALPFHTELLTHHKEACMAVLQEMERKKVFGDGGYRSPYLSHAKRALYHLSYVPRLLEHPGNGASDIQKSRSVTV